MKEISALRCLVVDDDEDDYQIAVDALVDIQTRPHEAEWACDYETDAEMLDQNEYNICLVDCRIGARTGLEFIQDSTDGGCRVPMILLTGISDQQVDEDAAKAGAYDFIEKSAIEPNTLERAIRYSVSLAQQMRKLQENSTLLRVTLEHTGAGIAAFNADRKLETYNSRLLEILDIKTEAANSEETEQDSGQSDDELEIQIIERLSLFEAHVQMDTEIENVDGRTIEVRFNKAPDGRLIIVCSDITARKAAEDELIRSREEAIAAAEAKTRFLTNMSHELRTPLNAIIGFSEFLKLEMSGAQIKEEWTSYIDNIHTSGTHLLTIINGILTLAKVDVGKAELQESSVYVKDIVGFCESSLTEFARTKNQVIGHQFCDEDLAIFCDENIMRQALLNLMSNSIKFTDEGGEISTTVEIGPDNEIRITVKDDGIGMNEEELQQCLHPFTQADNSLARRFEGTGLGLPLVDRYARLHGGSLEISSQKGRGTSATVVIPAERHINTQDPSQSGSQPNLAIAAS